MSKHDKPNPGKKTKEFPNGDKWRNYESTPQSTAGAPEVTMEPARLPWGAAVELRWSCADLSLTAGPNDAPRDYNGFACLSLRLSPAEFQELVSRGLVAMAGAEPEAAEAT